MVMDGGGRGGRVSILFFATRHGNSLILILKITRHYRNNLN